MGLETHPGQISSEALHKYADFVEVHSDEQPDGTLVYNPEKALVGLLSILTPDPKGIVLAGMEDRIIYSNDRQLHDDILLFLEKLGIRKDAFPVTHRATSGYCEYQGKTGEKRQGSLVKIGAVIREVVFQQGMETLGYMRSEAGRDLGIPLVYQAIEFVNQARESSVPHHYDSMWRLLGAINSSTDQRSPWTIYNAVEYLVNNPGIYRVTDIYEAFRQRNINETKLSRALISLGYAGVINDLTPTKDIEGYRGRGWARYRLSDPEKLYDVDNLYQQIKQKRSSFHNPGYLRRVAQYLSENPDSDFDINNLATKLPEISYHGIDTIISVLSITGVIEGIANGFKVGNTLTQVSANDLSRMFYEFILLPAMEEALSLTPITVKVPSRDYVATFILNYQEERSQMGPSAGEEVRNKILSILIKQDEMKVSHIAQEYNMGSTRELKPDSIGSQLTYLVHQGLIQKTRAGFYRLKQDS